MKVKRRGTAAIAAALALCAGLIFAACGTAGHEAGGRYALDHTRLALQVGESERLELSGNGMIILEGVEWSSSAVSVATVDENGRVTAVGAGESDITALYCGEPYLCRVSVEEVQTISLSETELYLTAGDAATLSLLRGSAALTEGVTWASSDPAVATVENGEIGCLSAGKTAIVAEYDGKFYECALTVCASPVGTYYADITVAEMENAHFEFDLVLDADKTYTYTRRDNTNAPDGPVAGGLVNSGTWKFEDENTLLFAFSGGAMRMRVRQNGALVSVGELPTGGMDAELTFTKISA